MLNIDKSKWKDTPTMEAVAKQIEAHYREFIVVTGEKGFKLFADKSFRYLITASTGIEDIHTYVANDYWKLIVKEKGGKVYNCFLTNHFKSVKINFE